MPAVEARKDGGHEIALAKEKLKMVSRVGRATEGCYYESVETEKPTRAAIAFAGCILGLLFLLVPCRVEAGRPSTENASFINCPLLCGAISGHDAVLSQFPESPARLVRKIRDWSLFAAVIGSVQRHRQTPLADREIGERHTSQAFSPRSRPAGRSPPFLCSF